MTIRLLRSKIHYPYGQPPNADDVLWRCEAKSYSYVIDPDREEYGTTTPRLEMYWYPIQRRTPKGAWVCNQFVRLTARKRWACSTEEDALESFRARRRVQVDILSKRLRRAQFELDLVDDHLNNKP